MSWFYPNIHAEGRSSSGWQPPVPTTIATSNSPTSEWPTNTQNSTSRGQPPEQEIPSHSRLYPRLEIPNLQVFYSGQPIVPETNSHSTANRPATINELADRVKIDWDPGADFKRYLRAAETYRKEGKESARRGDFETAFVQLAQAATLVLERLPEHKDYAIVLDTTHRHNLGMNGQDILDHLSEIKRTLVDRYDKWLQKHPEYTNLGPGLDLKVTTNAKASSNTREWHSNPTEHLVDPTKTPSHLAAWALNANDNPGWGSLSDQKIIASSSMTESRYYPTIFEHTDQSESLVPSSFSAKLSSMRTEDLTGLVSRDSDYPAHGGGYADVFIGSLQRKGKERRILKVAIKVIRSHTFTAANQWKIDKRLKREISLWSCLRHPNVVPLLGTTTGFGAYPAMVCPWMKDGNLSHYLNTKVHELNLRKRLQILADVIEGLAYLHMQPVIHGDLTTGNVLMDEGKAHLSDFGLSNVMIEVRNSSFMSSTVSGAPRWTAPELLHVGPGVPDVTTHCDIYSFGSIILQTITGRIPYENIALDVQVIMEVMRGGTPARPPEPLLSDEIWELIGSCWSRNPSARPEIGQVRERLHVLRYNLSEDQLTANIVDSQATQGYRREGVL